MRKYAAVIMAFVFLMWTVEASAAMSGTVLRVVGGSTTLANNVVKFPALVSTTAGVSKWVAVGCAATSIAPAIAAIAIGSLAAWGIEQAILRYTSSTNGATVKNGSEYGYNTYAPAWPSGYTPPADTVLVGYYATGSEAYNAVNAIPHWSGPTAGGSISGWSTFYVRGNEGGVGLVHMALYSAQTPPQGTPTFHAYTQSALQTEIQNAIQAGNQTTLPLVQAVLDRVDKALQGLSGAVTGAQLQAIKDAILGALTQQQQTDIQNVTVNPDTAATNQETVSSDAQHVKEGVAQALKDAKVAEQEAADAVTMPELPTAGEPPDPPDKGTVADVLMPFYAGLSSLPIVSFFQGIGISGSGDCTVPFYVPSFGGSGGGTITLSLCDYEAVFVFMGNCLLAIVGIRWTMYIFEG